MKTDTNNTVLCEKIWNECEPVLRRICNFKLSSYPSEIDDVIGDTYLALCNAINNGTIIRDYKAWLFGTVNNLIKMKYTEMNTIKKTLINIDTVEQELLYDISFDNVSLNDEIIEIVKQEIINELPGSERTLLILIYTKRLKFKEIALILNTTENAVKQRHYRLKLKIKKMVKEKINNLENFE